MQALFCKKLKFGKKIEKKVVFKLEIKQNARKSIEVRWICGFLNALMVCNDLVFSLKEIICEKHRFRLIETDAVDGLGKALAGDALLTEQKNGLLNYVKRLILLGEDLTHGASLRTFLSPSSAEGDFDSGSTAHGFEQALRHTASAVDAEAAVNLKNSVYDGCRAHRADSAHGTLFAAAALFGIKGGHHLANQTDIVQIGFYTVVRTAANGNLEFMGKLYRAVALIEAVVYLLGDRKRVQLSVTAGSSLAGDNRTHEGTGTAGGEPFLCDKGAEGFNLFIGDALHLHRHAASEGNISVAELLGCLRNTAALRGADLSVYCDHAGGKVVRPFIV